jgi:FKBP-type peptidyl-prolyl cis-trans isomerase
VSADAKAAEIEAAAKEKAAQEAAAAAAAAATAAAAGAAAPGAKGKEKKGFKKRTTKKAPSGAKTPTVGDNVRVMYKGTLEDGCVAARTARKWIADFVARCRAIIGTMIVIVSLSHGCAGLCSTRAQALTPRPPRSGSRCSLRLDKGV